MTRRTRLAIAAGNRLAAMLLWFSEWADAAHWRLKRCPECGENIFYGLPCPQFRK